MTYSAPGCATPEDQAIYVYAFVDATQSPRLQILAAEDGAFSLHLVGAIGALICQVPRAEFDGIEGEENLRDPAWIMPRICRHEAVVERAMEVSPTFPTAFATLYLTRNSLTEFMHRHQTEIMDFLEQVSGCQEWALKITIELGNVTTLENLALELWPEWSDLPPGTRYLRMRRERPSLIEAARKRAAESISEIVDALRPVTIAVRPMIRAKSSSPSADRHVEDYAILAHAEQRATLHECIGKLIVEGGEQHMQIASTGPWPPYSFRPSLDGAYVPDT
jgi:hypothetical protein